MRKFAAGIINLSLLPLPPDVIVMYRRLSHAVLVLLVLTGFGPTVFGSQIGLSTGVSVSGQYAGQSCSQTGTTTASCSASATIQLVPPNPSTYFFSGNADAIASFGSLGAFAAGLANCTATGINCGEPEGNVTAGASFEDLIKITNGPASGFLDFAIQTSGSGSAICSASVPVACANSFAGAQLAITSNELIDGLHQSGIGLTNGVSSHDVRIAFTSSGGVASVDFDLGLIAFIRCSVDNITTDCTASSDFIDTAQVTGVTVLDPNGNVIMGASLTSQSGTNYGAISAVPEPSSLILVGSLLGGLVLRGTLRKD